MKYLNYKYYFLIESFKDTIKIGNEDNLKVDYTFIDNLGNKYLVEFKNIKNTNTYSISYFVWDIDISNWSVSKIIKSNPWRIVKTVFGDIFSDFVNRKKNCTKIKFTGLSKDLQKELVSQRTKMYIRFLERNPLQGFRVTNYGNDITLQKIN